MAVGGGGASSAVRLPRRSAGEVAFDVDAPSNSSLAFEPAEVMTFTLVHPTPSKTFQLLSVVNLHPSHTTFFSVKTLKPERYFIKPSKCMLGPREQIVVRIELRQALYDEVIVHFSHEHKLVTDRLLIQSGCNTNPIHDSAFQAALQFKNEPKSKEKDAAWSAAWKTLTSSQIHAKNLIMRFEASPDFGKVPQTIDTSTPSTTAVALRATIPRQPAVSDPLFTTHESTFSIEEVFHDIPATQQQAPHSQRKLAPPKPTHVPAPRTAPPVDSSASRKSSVGKREKSGLSLALVPSTESLVFSVSPHNTTSYSTLSIENLAPHQRVCFTVRIESKFRCKSLPYRVGLIDGAGTASVQLELAMSLHNEIVQQLAQAVDIEPFKVRLQVMEMDDVTAAAATALPTDEARAQFLKALWQSPPKRMFVQKYVAAFVLDKTPPAATTVAAVVPTPAPAIVGPGGGGGDDDDKFGDAERLSVVSECASYATAFTRAPPMRPIMTPLEHLQYQRSLNRHLLNQNGTNDNAGPLRATILELTEADELFAAQENARQAKKDQVQPEPEPTIDSLIDPEILRQVVPSQPSVENIALQDKMQARPFAACPSKDMENSMPIVPTVASAEPDVVKSHPPVLAPTASMAAVPPARTLPTVPSETREKTTARVPPAVEPALLLPPTAPSTGHPVIVEAPVLTPRSAPAPSQVVRQSISSAALPPLASIPPPKSASPIEKTTTPSAPAEQTVTRSMPGDEEIVTRSVRTGSTTTQPVATLVPVAPARARSAVASSYLAAVASVSTSPTTSATSKRAPSVTPAVVASVVAVAPPHPLPAVVEGGASVTPQSTAPLAAAPVPVSPGIAAVEPATPVQLASRPEQSAQANASPLSTEATGDATAPEDPTLSSRSLSLSDGSSRPSSTTEDDASFMALEPSVDITPPVVDAALAAVGLDPSIKSQEGGFHVPSSVPPETPAATIDVDDDDSSQEQDESEESSGSEDSHEEIDAHDGRAASFPSDADSESSDGMDKFDEEGDDLVSELQPRRESHDDWSVFNPRPSTIDDDASGFSILTYSDSQSDQPRSPETAPTPAMDWVYDEQQQAFVETSAVHSAQDIPSPPTSPRSSSNLSPSAHHDRPPPLSTNGASPVASPTSSPARLSSHKSKSRFSLLKAFERNHGPSKPVGLVTLTPQTILYHMDVGSKPSGKVTLTNLTSSLVVYKIKSAQPARYKVKPSQGFIEPRGHVVVAVDLQVDAYDELIRLSSMELGDIRDCLLVETVKGPSSRSAKALRNAKTHGELVGILRALWSTVDKKEVNASRLFCEYSFDDSAYQSFTATVDGPTVPLVDEPKTPPATKQAKRFGWKRSKTNKVLRNAL